MKMSSPLPRIALLAFGFAPLLAASYGPNMHRDMSRNAVIGSRIEDALGRWEIDSSLENLAYPTADGGARTIIGLISEGSVEEDTPWSRVFGHFYDPIRDEGLRHCLGTFLTYPSPDWAISGTPQPDDRRFSYASARKAMRDAFISAPKTDRERNFGAMFEAIGHVIHHIQDMAQPQHVRNDAHQELVYPWNLLPWPFNNPSKYEEWAENQSAPSASAIMPSKPRSFWAGAGPVSGMAKYTNYNFVTQGSNFVIDGGVIKENGKYPNPKPVDAVTNNIEDLTRELGCPVPTAEDPQPTADDPRCSLRGEVQFIRTQVKDDVGGDQINERAAMYSIFTQDLTLRGITLNQNDSCGATPEFPVLGARLFSVNELTFPSTFRFVGPKAVAYSTGMLDYLVRGDIDLQVTLPNFQLEFRNKGDEPLTGTVTLYYDDKDGKRYPVPRGSWWVSSLEKNGVRYPNPFPAPVDPAPETPGKYMMVFTGTMGEETPIEGGPGAVVAKMVTLPAIEFYWSNNMGCMGCTVQPPDYPPFIGSAGWADLSFFVPPSWQSYLRDNKDQIKVKIGGVEYPANINPADGRMCEFFTSSLDAPVFGMNLQTETEAIVPSWQGILLGGGIVGWTNPEYSPQTFVTPDSAWPVVAYTMPGGVNSYPKCANQLRVNVPSPGTKIGIEYLVGNATLFKLCMKEELSDVATTGGYTTVISKLAGARVLPGAYKIRFDQQDNGGCAGN